MKKLTVQMTQLSEAEIEVPDDLYERVVKGGEVENEDLERVFEMAGDGGYSDVEWVSTVILDEQGEEVVCID